MDYSSYQDMFEEKRNILEPAGALSLAGALAYCKYYGISSKNVVAITSGANMNFARLRLVTELADVGAKREAVFVTFIPEEVGSFKRFMELVLDYCKYLWSSFIAPQINGILWKIDKFEHFFRLAP